MFKNPRKRKVKFLLNMTKKNDKLNENDDRNNNNNRLEKKNSSLYQECLFPLN